MLNRVQTRYVTWRIGEKGTHKYFSTNIWKIKVYLQSGDSSSNPRKAKIDMKADARTRLLYGQ